MHTMSMDPSRSEPASSSTRFAQAVWFPLPRMRAGAGTVVLTAGTGALLCSAGLGAALVHVVEYHVGLGTVDGRQASLAFMLAHCPVRGGLLVVFVAALLTLLAVWCELRALRHQQRSLTLIARNLPVLSPALPRTPLHRGRLVALFVTLLASQVALYALAERCLPMTVAMRMHSVPMDMAVQSTLPVLPVHLVVALLLALLVWRLEYRLVALQAVISALRRLLRRALQAPRRVHFPVVPLQAQLSRLCGPGALSRPPPV